jgi:hypothetical protein
MNARLALSLSAVFLLGIQAMLPQGPSEMIAMAVPIRADAEFGGGAIERSTAGLAPDPCMALEVAASPSRPNWSAGAATTQCNVLEFDSGWLWQPMGHGIRQRLLPSSMRYGLTPRLDLRWVCRDR